MFTRVFIFFFRLNPSVSLYTDVLCSVFFRFPRSLGFLHTQVRYLRLFFVSLSKRILRFFHCVRTIVEIKLDDSVYVLKFGCLDILNIIKLGHLYTVKKYRRHLLITSLIVSRPKLRVEIEGDQNRNSSKIVESSKSNK